MRAAFSIGLCLLACAARADELAQRVARFDHHEKKGGLAQLDPLLDIASLEDDVQDPEAVLAFLRRAQNAASPIVAARALKPP